VLIVGAGPTGLNLALWLTRLGISVRIVDNSAGPGETSRAVAVHARTLEFYRQLGFAEKAVERGIVADEILLRVGGTVANKLVLGKNDPAIQQLSPYPFFLAFPQDEHEQLLIEELRALSVEVERNTSLRVFTEVDGGVRAGIERSDGSREAVDVTYLCGCDGAHSTVRERLEVGFPGGTYDQVFYVADVHGNGGAADGNVNICFGPKTFVIALPVRRGEFTRVIGAIHRDVENATEPAFEEVAPTAQALTGMTIDRVRWFSTYRVHHRVANAFRKSSVFLLGDAAHIHSPAGGQGMNTGIGDAANLAWKIAQVLQKRCNPAILDTYETERIGFARRLVETTDRAFQLAVSQSELTEFFRTTVVPRVVPWLLRMTPFRVLWFKTLSQTEIEYRSSALSRGRGGYVNGGDRLPWVADCDNFAPLQSLDWQIHIYGRVDDAVRALAAGRNLPLHRYPWSLGARDAEIGQDSLYLVRPDGYVALAQSNQDAGKLERYLNEIEI